MPALQMKGTLMEVQGGAGPGGGLTPPQWRTGIVETLFQRLTVADLLASEQTSASQLRYVVEGTALNMAAPTAEGGQKPESTLGFTETVEPVRKIATYIGVSDELLEDAVQIQSYVNSRLSLFVRIKEEDQLLYGSGSAPNLQGLLNRSGIQNHSRGTFTNLDAIRQMITKSRDSFLEPDAVVIHPAQWENIELLKDGQGAYYGDPFRGGPRTLWNLPVVVTNVIGNGTALVGSFGQAAAIHRRGALTVEASNSHSDWFTKDLVAIRAETCLALAVYRPASFVRGTALVT
jgi:HK97 family phage major capsid protein